MPESKKVVIKVDVHDNKDKRKALKAVSSLSGIESIAMDMNDKKLTVVGNIDPVDVVGKLRKGGYVVGKLRKGGWHTEIVTVGPAKEEKKDEKKGEKKEEKKDEKKDEEERIKNWLAYHRYMTQPPYYLHSVEENPNSCVIC